ncbi:MAG: PepSY domain-containing protein [Nitrososphaera sp.]
MYLPQERSLYPHPTKKTLVTVITVSLFSFGILAASLLMYQTYSKSQSPVRISEAAAVAATLQVMTDRGIRSSVDEDSATAELLHVMNGGVALLVDKETMEDTPIISGDKIPEYENRYIWKVRMQNAYQSHEWETWIDATTGQVLLHASNGSVIFKQEG